MDADERAVQLYTLEYQKAAERYDNIYRSMWTIFSYLTAVAAGILAFGADKRIEWHGLICIAAIPLLFWFWTTYLPLDRYGNDVLRRLGEVERLLNREFNTKLNHFNPCADKEVSVFIGLWPALKAKNVRDLWKQVRRARFAIGLIFIVLHILVIWELKVFRNSGQPLFQEKPAAATPVGPAQNVTITGSSK